MFEKKNLLQTEKTFSTKNPILSNDAFSEMQVDFNGKKYEIVVLSKCTMTFLAERDGHYG